MIELVENDKVGVIIAKDMSRIGRNYLEVGLHTEMPFPEHDVRFIAVKSGGDNANQQDNDVTISYNYIGILPANLLYDVMSYERKGGMITHAAFPKTLLYCFIGPPRKRSPFFLAQSVGCPSEA